MDVDHHPSTTDGERGASLVEYALLVALIAIVCFAAVGFLGGATGESLDRSASRVQSAQQP